MASKCCWRGVVRKVSVVKERKSCFKKGSWRETNRRGIPLLKFKSRDVHS
ncbi:Protein of unknown function [Gryllus bimaculatus]|nr:Protein of unknown function [Gryllus bimaculatus]